MILAINYADESFSKAQKWNLETALRWGAEKNVEYGEIAQLARAHGSYPWCRGFDSPSRY